MFSFVALRKWFRVNLTAWIVLDFMALRKLREFLSTNWGGVRVVRNWDNFFLVNYSPNCFLRIQVSDGHEQWVKNILPTEWCKDLIQRGGVVLRLFSNALASLVLV